MDTGKSVKRNEYMYIAEKRTVALAHWSLLSALDLVL